MEDTAGLQAQGSTLSNIVTRAAVSDLRWRERAEAHSKGQLARMESTAGDREVTLHTHLLPDPD